jgi:hypothetical protein
MSLRSADNKPLLEHAAPSSLLASGSLEGAPRWDEVRFKLAAIIESWTSRQGPERHSPPPSAKATMRHGLVETADVTSLVITLKLASVHGPNEVTIATSVASRPRAIRMRPMRGLL